MKNGKELKKNIILLATILVALYLIYIFVQNWDIAAEAFRAGWNGN